jgi:predicted nucleic acid-binding protein
MTYILDACALIALLDKETGKGYEPVSDLLDRANRGEISLCMNLVNLVEVYYRYIQIKGTETADVIMEMVKTLPILFISDITDEIYFETARCKARYPMSLGDAFLCGTAKSLDAVIVTKD